MANLLFINHIPSQLGVSDLESMFRRDGLNVVNICNTDCLFRALATCPDQSVADRIIDKYNGLILHGCRLVVEPWLDMSAPPARTKVLSSEFFDSGSSRSRTSLRPEYCTSRTREFIKDKDSVGKFSYLEKEDS